MIEFNPLEEVGIKYRKIKINSDKYILIPCGKVIGYSMGEDYLSTTNYKIPVDKKTIQHEKFLIDEIISEADLQYKYSVYEVEEIGLLIDYYYEEELDYIIIVSTEGDQVKKRKIKIPNIKDFVTQEQFKRQKDIPSVVLNDASLQELLEAKNIEELKGKLKRLKQLIEKYIEAEKERDVTKITVENGKITEIDTDAKVVEKSPIITPTVTQPTTSTPSVDFTVQGLEKYLKERIFGHDEGIRVLSTKLYMNYTAQDNEEREKILIVGPTGTGKTETLRVASEYLNLPFIDGNAVNLVPEGYVGTSIESLLYSLILQAKGDIALAARGLVFLDEIDKLGNAKDELRTTMKEILLKYTEGSIFTFTRDKKSYSIDTRLLNKVFAGAFDRIFEKEKNPLGFGIGQMTTNKKFTTDELKERIKAKEYFGYELLDRIEEAIIYEALEYETKKRILLESKISKFLKKKERYERQFGISLIAEDSYVDAIFEALEKKRDSIRLLNNLVITTLDPAEYALCTNPNTQGKRLILTRDTVDNPHNFTIL